MKEHEYYIEIENYIKKNEINKRRRVLEENYDILNNYWNIGKLLVEAQGGEKRAKYGNELIKKWSKDFTKNYGKGYDYSNLSRFRQLYINFPNLGTVSQLSWSIICKLLPIRDVNKRNYYFNICIEKSLTVRKLKAEDKAQVEMYMKLVDDNLKKAYHNKTIGIIITKEQNKYVANFVRNDYLIPLEYILDSN